MKTLKLSLIAFLLLGLGVYSCKKDNSPASSSDAVTTDQVADMAAGSLAANSNGVASLTDNISSNATVVSSMGSGKSINSVGSSSIRQQCGTTLADSTTFSGSVDSVSFDYFVKYTRTLNCNASEQPDNIVNTLVFHGNYSGPNIMTTDSGSANATIGGLNRDSTSFVINGEYKRSGSYTSKIGNKGSGNRKIDIVLTNVMLSKPGRKIESGTATINITGTSPKGNFSYSGTITFNNDNTCMLRLRDVAYLIDLRTGFRIRRK